MKKTYTVVLTESALEFVVRALDRHWTYADPIEKQTYLELAKLLEGDDDE